jgi:hypothetical protein
MPSLLYFQAFPPSKLRFLLTIFAIMLEISALCFPIDISGGKSAAQARLADCRYLLQKVLATPLQVLFGE